MSNGDRLPYSFAKIMADQVVNILAPECERIEIAGSVRRHAREVGDIEVVLIPKKISADLFGTEVFGSQRIEQVLREHGFEILKNGELFKQARIQGVMVDVSLTTPEKWGVIFTLKTGNAYFNHKLVTKKKDGGMCPSNIDFQDGRLWRGGCVLETPEEKDVFEALALEWVQPENRL